MCLWQCTTNRIAVVQAVSNDAEKRGSNYCFHKINVCWYPLQMFHDLLLLVAKTINDISADVAN